MQVGSELRIRNTGEISVSNPTVEAAPAQDAADAVLDYRFDSHTGEHVLRLLLPATLPQARRRVKQQQKSDSGSSQEMA